MSMVWLTGHITEEELAVHHPKEYEQILRREAEEQAEVTQAQAEITAKEQQAEMPAENQTEEQPKTETKTVDFPRGDS